MVYIAEFKEWVMVEVGGQKYQCSDFYKWHAAVRVGPKDATLLTRDASEFQKLGSGWITVPNMP